MQRLIIDRLEGNVAVCETETGAMTEIELRKLPEGAREGSVLAYDGKNYTLDISTETTKRAHIQKKMDDLFID